MAGGDGTKCAQSAHVLSLPQSLSFGWHATASGLSVDFGRHGVFRFAEEVLAAGECLVRSARDADVLVVPFGAGRMWSREPVVALLEAARVAKSGKTLVWLPLMDDGGIGAYFDENDEVLARARALDSVFLAYHGLMSGHVTRAARGEFVGGVDIVLPPHHPFVADYARKPSLGFDPHRRPRLFFAGTVAKSSVWPVADGNGRLAAVEMADAARRDDFVVVDGYVDSVEASTFAAQFNLAPLGQIGGWGIRGAFGLAAGTPLVVVDVGCRQMLDELWAWSAFALHLEPSNATGIPDAIDSVDDEQLAQMRAAAGCTRGVLALDGLVESSHSLWLHVLATLVARKLGLQPQHPCQLDVLSLVGLP